MNFLVRVKKRLKEGWLKEFADELKWVGRYCRRYRWAILWYIFLGVLSTAVGFASGILSKYIIDAVTGYNSSALVPAAIGYLCMSLFRIGSSALTGRVSAKIEIKVNQEMKAEVFDTLMAADWEAVQPFHSGDLLNRLDNEVNTAASAVTGWIPNFFIGLVQFFGALGIILYYDSTLAMLALLSAPVTLLVSNIMVRKMRTNSFKMREASSEQMAFQEEAFQNIQYIKSFGLTEQYGTKLRKVQQKYKKIQLDFNKVSLVASSFMSLTGMAVTSICFAWGAYRLWAGAITYGTMTLFLQMANTLSSAFSSLLNMAPQAITAATAAGRIMAVTGLPTEDRSHSKEAEAFLNKFREQGLTLQMEHLGFWYQNGKQVLRDASFQVLPGEMAALVGPSGEGKTTILRIILGLVRGKEGQLTLRSADDSEIMEVSPSTRRLFTYVPQGNTMLSGTIETNLRLLKETATEEELWLAVRAACAEEFIQKLPEGLKTLLGEHGNGLSEGQVQRLSIARALLSDAPVMLLDEATSALDAATERQILKNLVHYKQKKTCVVTTHRPSVLTICDKVYKIQDCRLTYLNREQISEITQNY